MRVHSCELWPRDAAPAHANERGLGDGRSERRAWAFGREGHRSRIRGQKTCRRENAREDQGRRTAKYRAAGAAEAGAQVVRAARRVVVAALSEHMARAARGHGLGGQGCRVSKTRPLQADREHDQKRDKTLIHGVSLACLDTVCRGLRARSRAPRSRANWQPASAELVAGY
jgi:hypothetical protein